jgi:hypothetical protein
MAQFTEGPVTVANPSLNRIEPPTLLGGALMDDGETPMDIKRPE